jgi:hypothetical protein
MQQERVGEEGVESVVFVLPNPSGRNAAYPGFRDKLVWFRRLARSLADTRAL